MSTRNLRGNKLAWIRLSDFEALCFNLARQHFTFNQPIPDFITRSPRVLESCLETPLQQFGGKVIYPTLEKKLAILFYLLIKNHPFQNGNKRIALTAVLIILFLNERWLDAMPWAVYRLAIVTAESESKGKDKMLKRIRAFMKRHTVVLIHP